MISKHPADPTQMGNCTFSPADQEHQCLIKKHTHTHSGFFLSIQVNLYFVDYNTYINIEIAICESLRSIQSTAAFPTCASQNLSLSRRVVLKLSGHYIPGHATIPASLGQAADSWDPPGELLLQDLSEGLGGDLRLHF